MSKRPPTASYEEQNVPWKVICTVVPLPTCVPANIIQLNFCFCGIHHFFLLCLLLHHLFFFFKHSCLHCRFAFASHARTASESRGKCHCSIKDLERWTKSKTALCLSFVSSTMLPKCQKNNQHAESCRLCINQIFHTSSL